jgi:hypothetical protein
MKWVASTLHTTSEHGVSSITTADAHTSAASSRLTWRPRRFKWTRPFRRKRNLVSAHVPSHFNWTLRKITRGLQTVESVCKFVCVICWSCYVTVRALREMEACCFLTVRLTHCMLWRCCLVVSLFELLSFPLWITLKGITCRNNNFNKEVPLKRFSLFNRQILWMGYSDKVNSNHKTVRGR